MKEKSLITPLAGIFREEADKALKRIKERNLFKKRLREAEKLRSLRTNKK